MTLGSSGINKLLEVAMGFLHHAAVAHLEPASSPLTISADDPNKARQPNATSSLRSLESTQSGQVANQLAVAPFAQKGRRDDFRRDR